MEPTIVGIDQCKKILTLVYLLDDDRILLGLKKRGFGVGKVWSGYLLFCERINADMNRLNCTLSTYCCFVVVEWLWWKSTCQRRRNNSRRCYQRSQRRVWISCRKTRSTVYGYYRFWIHWKSRTFGSSCFWGQKI